MRFYFDFISPFAYLGWKQIRSLAARHHRELQLEPVLFAGLLGHHGQLGPAEVPPKRLYIFKQALRRAHDLGLPLSPPPAHPFNPLLGLRLASLPLVPEQRLRIVDDLFDAVWAGGGGIHEPERVVARLEALGLDGARLVAEASGDAAKARVREATDAAIAAGVFGVPTVIVDDELFWGADALGDVDRFLSGEDPIRPELLARWRDLPAAAVRPSRERRS